MNATSFPIRFDNTAKIKSEADLMELQGDKWLMGESLKENYEFKVGQRVRPNPEHSTTKQTIGTILGREKHPSSGFAMYYVAWDSAPKKFHPVKVEGGWITKTKEGDFWAKYERQKDLIAA